MAANLLGPCSRLCQVVGLHLWIVVAWMMLMLLMTLVLLVIDFDLDFDFDFVSSSSLQQFHLTTLKEYSCVYFYLHVNSN